MYTFKRLTKTLVIFVPIGLGIALLCVIFDAPSNSIFAGFPLFSSKHAVDQRGNQHIIDARNYARYASSTKNSEQNSSKQKMISIHSTEVEELDVNTSMLPIFPEYPSPKLRAASFLLTIILLVLSFILYRKRRDKLYYYLFVAACIPLIVHAWSILPQYSHFRYPRSWNAPFSYLKVADTTFWSIHRIIDKIAIWVILKLVPTITIFFVIILIYKKISSLSDKTKKQ